MKNLKIRTQVILILILLSIQLFYLGNQIISNQSSKVELNESIGNFLTLKRYASELVHQLQRERGRTALYLGSLSEDNLELLNKQREETNLAKTNYLDFTNKNSTITQKLTRSFQPISGKISKVFDEIRPDVDSKSANLKTVLSSYTGLINEILHLVDEVTEITADNNYYSSLRAYKSMMEMKERLGIIRAVYSNIFASDTLTVSNFKRTQNLESQFDVFKNDYFFFGSNKQKESFNNTLLPELKKLDIYKDKIKDFNQLDSFNVSSKTWFKEITKVIDKFYVEEQSIGTEISTSSSNNQIIAEEALTETLIIIGSLFLITLLLFIGLIRSVSRNINSLKENFHNVDDMVSNGSLDASLDLEKLGADFKEIGNIYNSSIQNLVTPIMIIKAALEKMENGDFKSRLEISEDMNHKYLVSMINNTLNQLPFEEISSVLESVKNGDLTARVQGEYKGDANLLKENINTLNNNFAELIMKISDMIKVITEAGLDLEKTADDMNNDTKMSFQQTEEVAAGIEEMSTSISENTHLSVETSENAEKNMEIAQSGVQVVNGTINKMKEIGEIVKDSVTGIKNLNQAGQKIGNATSVIEEIADQTNMLALNAAIEAARAGEMGRGFAVVADEVRKLAEKTSEATSEISSMIDEVQELTLQAVKGMSGGEIAVDSGVKMADEASQSLSTILNNASSVKDRLRIIANSSREQDITSNTMAENISQITNVNNQNISKIEGLASLSKQLVNLTESLDSMLSQFNTGATPSSLNQQQISNVNRKLLK
jgi:methyl-accepting chemotaxis protein